MGTFFQGHAFQGTKAGVINQIMRVPDWLMRAAKGALFFVATLFVCTTVNFLAQKLGIQPPLLCDPSAAVCSRTRPVQSAHRSLGEMALITAASRYYFDRLSNFVGSVHYWEPNQKLIVYDLGLLPGDREQA